MGNSQETPHTKWKISANTLIMTRSGPRRVSSLKSTEIVELSTNVGWVKIRRRPFEYITMNEIEISDGTIITLSPDTPLTISGLIAPGEILFKSITFNSPDIIFTDWYALGHNYGSKSLKNIHEPIKEFPADEISSANFINGWADAQSGFLFGTYEEALILFFILKMANIHNVIIELAYGDVYKISASTFKHIRDNTKWCTYLSKKSRQIVCVTKCKKIKSCGFELVYGESPLIKFLDIGIVNIPIFDNNIVISDQMDRADSETSTPTSSEDSISLFDENSTAIVISV